MYLWKNKQFRPLVLIIVTFILYATLLITSFILMAFFNQDWLGKPLDWIGIGVNILMIILLTIYWKNYNEDSIKREKELQELREQSMNEEERRELWMKHDLPGSLYVPPFNHKKARKEVGRIFIIAILANIAGMIISFVN